jgi:hypothetical protein
VYEIAEALRRVARLCSNVDADETLLGELRQSGLSEHDWDLLVDAVRHGQVRQLPPLLDAVETAGESACIDGVTSTTRQYQPLPGSERIRKVSGWLCPHLHPCGRVELDATGQGEVRCALTGDPMTGRSVTSG